MNPLQKNLLRSAVGAALVFGAAGPVRADAFAQSILVIDNFRLLHADGTPYDAIDLIGLSGTNEARLGGQWNAASSSLTERAEFGTGAALDAARRHVGSGVAPYAENSFLPADPAAAAPASFGYADARMDGAVITTTLRTPAELAQTRADAALSSPGSASGNAGLDSAASFNFSLGASETMTIAFSARPFAQVALGAGAAGASASAAMSWSVSVLDLNTGATVFTFQPEQLNAMGSLSRSGVDGASVYAPGTLSFAATTDLLNAGAFYQITIMQSSTASALQARQMPEPGTLAVFGAGLLAMAALARRRRAGAPPGNA